MEGKAKRATVTFKIGPELEKFFDGDSAVFDEAKEKSVEAMSRVWADGAKDITRADHHIQTAAYINSIGYAGNYVGPKGNKVGSVINESEKNGSKLTLRVGSGVSYASRLEKKYNIFGRALDSYLEDMASVGLQYIKQVVKKRRSR